MSSESLRGVRSPPPADELSSIKDGRALNSGMKSHPEQPEEVSFSSLSFLSFFIGIC
jgi:hypothetical protein